MKLIDTINKRLRGLFVRRVRKPLALRHTNPGRVAMPDAEEYYLGFRHGNGALVRLTRKKSSFWDVLNAKRYLNSGRLTPLYFILDQRNRIVSTIDHKFMTVCA